MVGRAARCPQGCWTEVALVRLDLSRFDSLLKNFARSGSGQVNNGVAVVDVDPNSDLIRGLTTAFRANGHHWGTLEHVIETPFFVDSKIVSGIQLADICAYAVSRYIEKPDRAGNRLTSIPEKPRRDTALRRIPE